MRWLWRCFQSRYDNNPFFLSQFIEKSPIFKKREIENGVKEKETVQRSEIKTKQQQVKCSITTTAAIAELIGQTSKMAQGASGSATAAQFPGFAQSWCFASPAGWLAQLVQLLFYFDC